MSGVEARQERWHRRLLWALFARPLQFLIWLVYAACCRFLVPLLFRVERVGARPRGPCVLAVTHVGTFEPMFVAYAGRVFRAKALFAVDPRYPWLRFIYGAFWGFEVTTDPERKKWLNRRSLARAVEYLKRGGVVMVFPEGERFWERVLYPGAGVLARRARVPLIPVGLENACCYHPQAEAQPLLAAAWRIIRETREKGTIRVHFGSPLMPDPRLPEREDVDRLMRGVARVFGDWDRRFYGFPPPQWPPGSGA
jgi:1-acyl-sn-glycerol-3-phosphate acyltransferase